MSFNNGIWTDPDEIELERIANSILNPPPVAPPQAVVPSNFNEIVDSVVTSTVEATKHFINTKVYSQTAKLRNLLGKKVDIIIPVYNAIHLTETCIRAVYERTDWPFDLYVVDDASNQGAKVILQKLQQEFNFTLLTNNKNHGFAASVNKGCKAGSNEFIVLLNSDVLVTDGWLSKMLLAMEDDKRNQIVNPVTNNTAQIKVDMYPGYSYLSMNKALEAYSERRYPEIMPTGFCYMVRRDLFQRQGYFSPNFINFGEEALDITTPIYTPKGMRTVSDIQEGDDVYAIDGTPTKVTKTTKIIYGRPCFQLTFNNGQQIIADAGHKWEVLDRRNKLRNRVVTTQEISENWKYKNLNRFFIELPKPVEMPANTVPIDPYLLGAWLGDGTSAAATMTSNDPEIIGYFAAGGWTTKKLKPDYLYSITTSLVELNGRDSKGRFVRTNSNSFQGKLRSIGVLKNKHIPFNYEQNTIANRLALLQGLMDTDGHISSSGRCTFANTNKSIIDSLQRIISSLGMYCSIIPCKKKTPSCADSWKINFRPGKADLPVFRLSRKLDRQLNAKDKRFATKHLRITNVEKVESVPVKCIGVAHPSHLFLCSNSFIPTHNTNNWMETITHTEGAQYPHYRAVLADDTYVFHQRSVSFAGLGEDENMKLRSKAAAKFHKQWPQYGQVAKKIDCQKELEVLRTPLSADHLNLLVKSKYKICWLVHSVEMCGGMMYIADIVNEINERGGDARVALVKRKAELPVNPIAELRMAPVVFESYQDVLSSFTSKVFSDGIVVASTVELSPVVTQLTNNVKTLSPLLHVQSYEPDLVDDPALKTSLEAQFSLIPNIITNSSWVNKKIRHLIKN